MARSSSSRGSISIASRYVLLLAAPVFKRALLRRYREQRKANILTPPRPMEQGSRGWQLVIRQIEKGRLFGGGSFKLLVGGQVFGARGLHREAVTALILWIARVPPHPGKLDLMPLTEIKQLLPQVWIDGTLSGSTHPAVRAPALRPALFHRLHQILRVGIQEDIARFLERFQALDSCHQFHAIVRRASKSS